MSSGFLGLLQSWTQGREEAPSTQLVPFGSAPVHSFCLSPGAWASRIGVRGWVRKLGTLCARCASLSRECCRAAAGPATSQTVLHVYGAPRNTLQSQLSSIQVQSGRRIALHTSELLTHPSIVPLRWGRPFRRTSA
jgi:hypothetical protein